MGTKVVSLDGNSFAIVKKRTARPSSSKKFTEKDPLSMSGAFNSQNESEISPTEQDPLSIDKPTVVKEEINFGSDDYAYLRMDYSDSEPMSGVREVQIARKKPHVISTKKRPITLSNKKKKLSAAMTKTVPEWKSSFQSYCTVCGKRWNRIHYKRNETCPTCKVRLSYRCTSCGKHYFARSGACYHVKYACGKPPDRFSCTYPKCPFKTKDAAKLSEHQKLKHLFLSIPSSDPLQLVPAESNIDTQPTGESSIKSEDLSNAILPVDPLALSPTKNFDIGSSSKTQRTIGPKILSVSIVRQDSMLSNLFKPAGKSSIVPMNPQDPLLSPTDFDKREKDQLDIKPECDPILSEEILPPIPPLRIINQSRISQNSRDSSIPFKSARSTVKVSKKKKPKTKRRNFPTLSSSKLSCPKCSVEFTIKTWYKNHVRYCGTSFRLFECSQCQYNTLYKRKMRKHVITHVDKSDYYKCRECDRSYKHKKHLTAHMKHYCNQRTEFQCDLCAYKCFIKPYMVKHMTYKHGF